MREISLKIRPLPAGFAGLSRTGAADGVGIRLALLGCVETGRK
jgi:hypothetical protein